MRYKVGQILVLSFLLNGSSVSLITIHKGRIKNYYLNSRTCDTRIKKNTYLCPLGGASAHHDFWAGMCKSYLGAFWGLEVSSILILPLRYWRMYLDNDRRLVAGSLDPRLRSSPLSSLTRWPANTLQPWKKITLRIYNNPKKLGEKGEKLSQNIFSVLFAKKMGGRGKVSLLWGEAGGFYNPSFIA